MKPLTMLLSRNIILLSVLYIFLNCSIAGFTDFSGNLIVNPGFETDGMPSINGWTGKMEDVMGDDASPGGGKFCLRLRPRWYPEEGYAETYVTHLSGEAEYEFSAWIKNIGGKSKIYLIQKHENRQEILKEIINRDTEWNQVKLLTKITAGEQDTLIIRLSAGSTEMKTWQSLFDNISLVKK